MRKRNFLILATFALGCIHASSDYSEKKTEVADERVKKIAIMDTTLNYRPFNKFNKDTLAYLQYNFKKRKAAYINKKLKFLLNDFELPIVEYTIAPWNTRHPELLQSLGLYFEKSNVSYRKFKNYVPLNGLIIKLKKPVKFETVKKLKKESNYKWVSPVTDFYGEIEIEDISIIGISNTKD